MFITVALPRGTHDVRLVYRTAGATAGVVISVASAGALLALALVAPRARRR